MYFHKNILVPRLTLPTDPQESVLELACGVIEKVYVGFPYGCAGLVGVRILAYQSQIVPLNEDDYLAWDEHVFPVLVRFSLWQNPYQVNILTFNEDDTYNHRVFVGVELLPVTAEAMLSTWLAWLGGGE